MRNAQPDRDTCQRVDQEMRATRRQVESYEATGFSIRATTAIGGFSSSATSARPRVCLAQCPQTLANVDWTVLSSAQIRSLVRRWRQSKYLRFLRGALRASSRSHSSYEIFEMRSRRIGVCRSLALLQSQQRTFPQPPTRSDLRKRPGWNSQVHPGGSGPGWES